MTTSQIFAVLDVKLGAFAQPFFAQNSAFAQRMFFDAARDPNTMLGKHPQDFFLYRLGTFDEESGYIEALVKPENLGNAVMPTTKE